MKEFKNYLVCIITPLFAFTFFFGIPSLIYFNKVNSDEQISSSSSSSAIKSAEQCVYDFFEAVQKNDYDTLKKVSIDIRMSEDIRRNTLKMQHEDGLLPEKPPTILSSEKRGEDMVIVKVSYVLDGEERIMIYPVILVNNEWVIDLANALPEGAVVLSDNLIPQN
ncbi:MAG: hypothetical protein VR67_18035 [Peptococcaceae bacterium BRH_c8a]|nr:MAG: hypothetical protein VR67_18035 [Peptococcaceae bacterium BRH_c8a]